MAIAVMRYTFCAKSQQLACFQSAPINLSKHTLALLAWLLLTTAMPEFSAASHAAASTRIQAYLFLCVKPMQMPGSALVLMSPSLPYSVSTARF